MAHVPIELGCLNDYYYYYYAVKLVFDALVRAIIVDANQGMQNFVQIVSFTHE